MFPFGLPPLTSILLIVPFQVLASIFLSAPEEKAFAFPMPPGGFRANNKKIGSY